MDFCKFAQNQLAEVGITCEVKIMEWGAYLDAIFAGEHEMTVLGYLPGADPATGMYNLFSSKCFGPGRQYLLVCQRRSGSAGF